LPLYRLVLCPDMRGEQRIIEFEAADPAAAFAFVERQDDFVQAEIWQGEQLLCNVKATPATGKIWTVKPSVGKSIVRNMKENSKKMKR